MNRLYYGDNLAVLRGEIQDASVDLIYLDPPFNSQASYSAMVRARKGERSRRPVEAFADTWRWDGSAEQAFEDVMKGGSEVAGLLRALRCFLKENDMMAYLAMMAVRLLELHRVLKPSGSLYLHCDPTASHYLKLLLDGIFGGRNFLNEIVWRRTGSHNKANRFGPVHDVLLFYRKSNEYKHRAVFRPYLQGHVDSYFKKQDERGRYWTNSIHGSGIRRGESGLPWRGYDPTARGRHWAIPSESVEALGIDPELSIAAKLDVLDALGVIHLPDPASGALPTYRQYLDRSPGIPLQDIWAYQPHTRRVLHGTNQAIDEDVRWLNAQGDEERMGYPTQKPLGLLERIVNASSKEGDVVLDPFCGGGTTLHAAQKLRRQWIGIDVTSLAIGLVEKRIKDAFPEAEFAVCGTPRDLAGARSLFARDRDQFRWWAVSLVHGIPCAGKKPDSRVHGVIYYKSGEKVIIFVQSGEGIDANRVQDLAQVVDREHAQFGILITLAEGICAADSKVRIHTIAELLASGRRGRDLVGDHQERPQIRDPK